MQCGKGKVVKVTAIAAQGRTATVLLRDSNKLVLEEAECLTTCLPHPCRAATTRWSLLHCCTTLQLLPYNTNKCLFSHCLAVSRSAARARW